MNAHVAPPSPDRVFTAAYQPGRTRVIIAAITGVCGAFAVAAVATGGFAGAWIALAWAAAFHSWPVLTARTALRFDSAGLTVDGVGRLPWEAVRQARFSERPFGRGKVALLTFVLAAPPSIAIVGARPGLIRRMQLQYARVIRDEAVVVVVSGLGDPPATIRQAVEFFLPDRAAWPRGLNV